MGKVQNHDFSQFDRNQWVDFLKEGAYRGAKINRMARKNNSSSKLIKDQNQIELIYGTKKITIKLAKLLKKHDNWTFSRLIHNLKMVFSSTFEKDFNNRIERLADQLVRNKPLNDFVNTPGGDVKQFFLANQKFINSSIGDQQVQDDLFKLAGMAKDPNLAHMIAAKATGAMPLPSDMSFTSLPAEVQQLIFSQMSNPQKKLVSKQINVNVKDNLKDLGCKTAKEAVEYVILNQWSAADLSSFDDFEIEDLENLSKFATLEVLSFPGNKFMNDELADVIKNFKALRRLSLSAWSYTNGAFITTTLTLDNATLKAINHLRNLQHLAMPQNQLYAIDVNPNIQTLEFFNENNLKFKDVNEIMKTFPNLQKLYLDRPILDRKQIHQAFPSLQIEYRVD